MISISRTHARDGAEAYAVATAKASSRTQSHSSNGANADAVGWRLAGETVLASKTVESGGYGFAGERLDLVAHGADLR